MNRYISTFLLAILLPLVAWAQGSEVLVRYVKTDGAYTNDGTSWATAKNNVQDAINDLYDQIKNTDKVGHVYVAAGTYYPTESTESDKDGTAYTAFKIYEGITVYGGFPADGSIGTPEARPYTDKNSDTPYYYGKKFTNVTILDGNHTNMGDKKNLVWSETKQQYTTTFPGNSYHVVWFATKGFDANGRAKGLSKPARLDGCTVQGGYASNRSTTGGRHHNSYGGGIYMVAGSYVDNCIVTQNAATRAGGAIYLDGGGEVDHSYVRYNQTLGIGVDDGFGGGVCVEDAGVVRHTVMAENVARMGGGLALLAEEEEPTGGNRYAPAAAGCVVGNNTTITEAGGVYMRYGGVLNHLAIVNNRCNGANLVYHGRRYGRSAGIYIDKYGEVFNTVCWGGEVEANSNIQYAAYTDANQTERPFVHYSAFAQNEVTDWSSTTRMDVFSLSEKNEDYENDGNYPEFINPTIRIDHDADNDAIAHFAGTGVEEKATALGVADFAPLWQPYRNSYLRGKGVMLKEYDYALERWERLKQASIEEDFQGTKFSPKTALGAFVTRSEDITPAEITVDGKTYLTLFVDPSRTSSKSIHHTIQDSHVGDSWDNPLGNLNDALLYFSMKEGKEGGATEVIRGRILVKEGETNTRGNYMAGNLRSSSFIMVSNVEVYGGYSKELTGTSETDRDPVKYPTHVTGDLADDKYANNVHHLVRFGDVQNAVFDGFRLYAGNAYSTAISTASSRHGGGVIVYTTSNESTCTNNVLRNCVIANCTALQGAGIYVTGLGQDLANDPARTVSLEVENCIIHNNTSMDNTPSAICARGSKTTLTLNHCTVRGNIGYGVAATENATVTMNNSVIHANATVAMNEIATLATDASNVRTLYTNGTGSITGNYNLLDAGSTILPTATVANSNQAILTYAENTTDSNYPKFVNPTRNVGHSEEVDNTIYGGYPNFMPANSSPLVNAANATSNGTDITTTHTRNYGGLPDVGAVENTDLPEGGTVIYVRDYRDENGKIDLTRGGDGSSWANAINGNLVYHREDGLVWNDTQGIATSDEANGSRYEDNAAYKGLYNSDSGSENLNDKTDGDQENTSYPYSIDLFNSNNHEYTSGLQYAVNKARKAMLDSYLEQTGTSVPEKWDNVAKLQVWVAEGNYTDGKGFKMQDGVDVYGGFPNKGNPGMKERDPSKYRPTIQVFHVTKDDYATIIPDKVSSTTYGDPAYDSRRVLTQPRSVTGGTNEAGYNGTGAYNIGTDRTNPENYSDSDLLKIGSFHFVTKWDGFNIQGGYCQTNQGNEGGGGAMIRVNGRLENCIIQYNIGNNVYGGGLMVRRGVIANCIIRNNRNTTGDGGGLSTSKYATLYNCVIYDNYCSNKGTQCFMNQALFYNNTIVCTGTTELGSTQFFSLGWVDGSTFMNNIIWGHPGDFTGNPSYMVVNLDQSNFTSSGNITSNADDTQSSHVYPNFIDYANGNFRLKDASSSAVNKGEENLYFISNSKTFDITLPNTDMDYTERIKDCTVDVGAYEYNGAANLTSGSETDMPDAAIYYVTQNGRGTASGESPAEAACWTKLQKVLDAAGRYKYDHPATQVIVKLAAFPSGGNTGYMPRRSSVTKANDPDAENPRTYSIIVPRGVEVWGGYSDADDGFLEENRNITTNKTTLSGLYQTEGQDVNVYHVVTFTDNTFDTEGNVRTESLKGCSKN